MDRKSIDINMVLDAEHQALLTGDYALLGALTDIKQSLLADHAVPDPTLEIRRKLDRNQTLLAMAISGIRAARGQIDAIERQRHGFNAYDRDGGRNAVGKIGSEFERKI